VNTYQYIERKISERLLARIQAQVCGRQMNPSLPVPVMPPTAEIPASDPGTGPLAPPKICDYRGR
jgi:hypothetical protein